MLTPVAQRFNTALIHTTPRQALCVVSSVAFASIYAAGIATSTLSLAVAGATLLTGISIIALRQPNPKTRRQMIAFELYQIIDNQMPKMVHHWFGYKSATGEHPLLVGLRQTYLALFHHPASFKTYTPDPSSLTQITQLEPSNVGDARVKGKWGGHASFELTIANDFRIWFDPVDGDIPFMAGKSLYPQMTSFALDGQPNLCCITHDHSDHCEVPRLEKLMDQGTTLLVPENADTLFKYDNVLALQWGEGIIHTHGNYKICVTHVPAFHSSQRGLFDCQQRGFGGYVVQVKENEDVLQTIYNAGDTAYNKQLAQFIQDAFHPNVVLCSISPTEKEEELHATIEQWHEMIRLFGNTDNKVTVIPQHYGKYAYEYTQDGNEQILSPLRKFEENFPDDVAILTSFKIGEEKVLLV